MRISVTGATGHLGGHLVRTLLDEGHTVRALVKGDTRAIDGLPVERVSGDLHDAEALRRAFDGAEVVYHLAARISLVFGDEDAVRRTNVEGVRNVVAAARAASVRRLVHFSSVHAYNSYGQPEIHEDGPMADAEPRVPLYDRTKALGERIVREAIERDGLDAVIINPTGCLGPLDHKPSAAGQVIIDLAVGRIPAIIQGGFNWVDARDVVRAAVAASTRAARGNRYLVGGHWASFAELSAIIDDVTGTKRRRVVLPMWLGRAAAPFAETYTRIRRGPVRFTRASLHALRHHRHISDARARKDLGHAPRPLRETVADTIAWHREAGRLP